MNWNGVEVNPMPICWQNNLAGEQGWTRYKTTWCGIKFQDGSFCTVTTEREDVTCEHCIDQAAFGLLAALP